MCLDKRLVEYVLSLPMTLTFDGCGTGCFETGLCVVPGFLRHVGVPHLSSQVGVNEMFCFCVKHRPGRVLMSKAADPPYAPRDCVGLGSERMARGVGPGTQMQMEGVALCCGASRAHGGGGGGTKTQRGSLDGLRTEVWGQPKPSNDPRNNQHNPNTPTTGRR